MIAKVLNKVKTEKYLREYSAGGALRATDESLIQWGIIGTGPMAERFARVLARHEKSNVRSVSSRSVEKAQAFAKRHGAVASYEGVGSFAFGEAGRIGIAYIATPVEAHFSNAKECINQGINVLCEKPLCETAEQTAELYRLADERGVFLMEAMWSYCLPTYKKANEWLSEGLVGKVESIDVTLCKDEPRPSKSVMNDYGTYAMAFAEMFTSGTLSLENVKRVDYPQSDGIDCDWEIKAADDGQIEVCIRISATCKKDNKAVIRCSKGFIKFEDQFNRTNKLGAFDSGGKAIEEVLFDYASEGYEYQVDDAIKYITGEAGSGFDKKLSVKTAEIRSELLSFEGGLK